MSRLGRKLLSGLLCSGLLLSSIGNVWADEQKLEDFSYELTVRSGEGGELVVSYGSESCTVDSESPTVLLISEGAEVKVSSTPVEGYAVEGISVVDMDGNTVDCVEDMGSVSFEMSDGRLLEGNFTRIGKGAGTEEENLGSTFAE